MRSASAASRAAFASALPSLRLKLGRTIRCSSLSPSASVVSSPPTTLDHAPFIKDVASTSPPDNLQCLLDVLQAKGETIVSPGAKKGLLPLIIPLSENPSGTLTSLLRWPTAPPEMEMPVVEVRKHGLWLLAKNVDQYIHRLLVEEDVGNVEAGDILWDASGEAGRKLYKKGDAKEAGAAGLDVYILKKVGLFPDVLERKVASHFEKGDQVSALITGEFYTRNQFPGFGRPYVCYAEILLKVGRINEAKDAARVALKSPWWTLGSRYQEVAEIAQWEDEQIDFIQEKVSEEGRREDLKKGKAPEQVALDEAAFLMDLASVEGTWDDIIDRVVECYREAGLEDMARFIAYRD
ncbi:cyclin delta-3 [Rhynchospora pubera]|uniref:Cyclin delta-3 n=1 Tax=Rhynchospora pubera TaxID=906938 RepID=A0AAV8C8E5_9POAL|nr:cyclin delta-3 [Rhynchospora pubera]